MCGIAGIIGGNARSQQNLVPQMLEAIKHRGPDGRGVDTFDHAALGHVRLSIVDLVNGKQPMRDVSERLSVVFNGEIYGYRDMKPRLDYPFRTTCDTEVLLALYRKHGQQMLKYLPGMFAFALWDESEQTLFCGRDRFGEKPFFYAWGRNGEFIFASEIKAILATGLVDPVLDYAQLHHYLCYSYIYPTRTIYQNVYTLSPGHQLIWRDGKVRVEPYWTLPPRGDSITEDEAVEKFRFLFQQAVRRQLVADVPVCAFLSGGLDSGSVVAMAAQQVPQLTTISFGFKGGINELSQARTMAERYGTHHIEMMDIDFDLAELMHTMQWLYDEPMADGASMPAYLIAKAARQHAKVVLTGDAGDEILGGYDHRYRTIMYMQRWQGKDTRWDEMLLHVYYRVFQRVRMFLRQHGLYSRDPSVQLSEPRYHDIFIRQRAYQWLKEGNYDVVSLLRDKNCFVGPQVVQSVELFEQPIQDYWQTQGFLPNNDADNAIRLDLLEYLPGNGMRKTDRTTMAVSLESRTPFLDVDLAEFCISLPFSLKVREMEEKYVMRRAMQPYWTKRVSHSTKNGFGAPVHLWMQQPKFRELEEEYLGNRNGYMFAVMDYDAIQRLRQERREIFLLWELLILAMWFAKHPCRV